MLLWHIQMREDLERTLETLDALEVTCSVLVCPSCISSVGVSDISCAFIFMFCQNIRCPLLSEDDDERVGTEDDADDEDDTEDGDEDDGEDEDEDEDMNVGEDDDLVGVHFQDDVDFDDVEEEEEEEDVGDDEEAEGLNGNEVS